MRFSCTTDAYSQALAISADRTEGLDHTSNAYLGTHEINITMDHTIDLRNLHPRPSRHLPLKECLVETVSRELLVNSS
jgi:hypothetical protein